MRAQCAAASALPAKRTTAACGSLGVPVGVCKRVTRRALFCFFFVVLNFLTIFIFAVFRRRCVRQRRHALDRILCGASRRAATPLNGALQYQTQQIVTDLANELGIQREQINDRFANPADRLEMRGQVVHKSAVDKGSDTQAVKDAYPGMMFQNVAGAENKLFEELMDLGDVKGTWATFKIDEQPDFRSFARQVIGAESHRYLFDAFRFRADNDYSTDARAYLEFFRSDWDLYGPYTYPIGGMIEFTKRMEAFVRVKGACGYLGETVTSIDAKRNGDFVVTTDKRVFKSAYVVDAIEVHAHRQIGGEIGRAINGAKEMKALLPVKGATVVQWFPNKWWEGLQINNAPVNRAWTKQQCFDIVEFPSPDWAYARNQNAVRVVYSDSIECTDFWERAFASNNYLAEIERGLKAMFPELDIPKPLHSEPKLWHHAWTWVGSGHGVTHESIAQWALNPLKAFGIRTCALRRRCRSCSHTCRCVLQPTAATPWSATRTARCAAAGPRPPISAPFAT